MNRSDGRAGAIRALPHRADIGRVQKVPVSSSCMRLSFSSAAAARTLGKSSVGDRLNVLSDRHLISRAPWLRLRSRLHCPSKNTSNCILPHTAVKVQLFSPARACVVEEIRRRRGGLPLMSDGGGGATLPPTVPRAHTPRRSSTDRAFR